jgi:hypothetical protein
MFEQLSLPSCALGQNANKDMGLALDGRNRPKTRDLQRKMIVRILPPAFQGEGRPLHFDTGRVDHWVLARCTYEGIGRL